MSFSAIAALAFLASGGISMLGTNLQAKENIRQATEDVSDANKDLVKSKAFTVGSLLAGSASVGISGDSVSARSGRVVTDYTKQLNKNNEELETFIKSTKTNQTLNNISTILGTGTTVMQAGYSAGWFNNDSVPPTPQRPQQWGYSQGGGAAWKSLWSPSGKPNIQ